MNDAEGLRHDLNWLFGKLCVCDECNYIRNQQVFVDMELFYDSTSFGRRSRDEQLGLD